MNGNHSTTDKRKCSSNGSRRCQLRTALGIYSTPEKDGAGHRLGPQRDRSFYPPVAARCRTQSASPRIQGTVNPTSIDRPHGVATDKLPQLWRTTDQVTAALLIDLKQRSLLDDTLVVWGGEFGRTIYAQSQGRNWDAIITRIASRRCLPAPL